MSTEKQSYPECVRAIAEEMAAKSRPKQWEACFREREDITAQYMEAARIALKHMADSVIHALEQDYAPYEPGNPQCCINNWLLEQGLIPEQEGGKDETI